MKEISHSNFHSFHYSSVQFVPSFWVDEDDNTVSLQMNAVNSMSNKDETLWAMGHVTFVLTHKQLEQLSRVVAQAIHKVTPKPEIDDIVRNLEESAGGNYDALKGLLY